VDLRERIRAVLALDPDARAIEYDGHWYTWGEIGRLGASLSARLEEAGLGAGAAVGLLLRNRPAMVAALAEVIASGRCAFTINPHQGEAALRRDLEALRVPVLVGTAEDWDGGVVPEIARETGAVGIRLEIGAEAERTTDNERPEGEHQPPLPGVAIQMLTSGTTGRPKRIELRESALTHSLVGAKHYESGDDATPRLRSGVAILTAPLVHVSGSWRTLQCICDGRSLALLDRFDVDRWVDLVVRHRPRTVSLVPTALRMVLEADLDPALLSSLKAVVSGTAPLPPEDAEAFEERYGVPVLTSYGATEFAGGVAGWNLKDHRAHRAAKRGSVGRAHPGCELRVVAPDSGEALSPGEEGLLEVRSAQLGQDSDWVRTTDLARLDADGFLWITGRADSAILRGGFKVHPDIVRKALEEHPAVREAAVVGLDDERLGQVPVAAVECVPGESVDEAALRAFARERLTGYQVPVRIAFVDSLPRTPSLKVSQPGVRALFTERSDA
jgi:acyl-CoA synthetase (AMP-forming)/AMP-acid ligase II